MGNHFSFYRQLFRTETGLNFWLGGAKASHEYFYPASPDELIDWAFETSAIYNMYLEKGVSRRKKTAEVCSGDIQSDYDPSSSPRKLNFVPRVLKSSVEKLISLPSLSVLERIRFFSENVIVEAKDEDSYSRVVPLEIFLDLHILLLRYMDILRTIKSQAPASSKHFCSICLDEDVDLIVLSCSHSLCTACNSKWVSLKSSCPFCRKDFPRRSINCHKWEMLEWQPKDVIVDIFKLESKIEEIECDINSSREHKDLLYAYEKVRRSISVYEHDNILIVDKKGLET